MVWFMIWPNGGELIKPNPNRWILAYDDDNDDKQSSHQGLENTTLKKKRLQ